jgi:hypothetical protein
MVVLHVKSAVPAASASSSPSQDGDEETEFLYECAASAAVADVAAALAALAGLQAALLSLCRRLRGERLHPETPCVVLVLASLCGGRRSSRTDAAWPFLRSAARCAGAGMTGELERALDEAEAYASKVSIVFPTPSLFPRTLLLRKNLMLSLN